MDTSAADVGSDEATDSFVRIETEIEIARPAPEVFDYATTPALWPTWHPATVAVRDVPQQPLGVGETMLETIRVAGNQTEALWVVEACLPPQRWQIATDAAQGRARIVYRFTSTPQGCRFHRTLDFRSKNAFWRALDSTLTRWILVCQSARALANLKRVLEA
jgi:uncharacterized protein YndB with AHSA1/START domain